MAEPTPLEPAPSPTRSELVRGCRVIGRVVAKDESSTPLPGVLVVASRSRFDAQASRPPSDALKSKTITDGSFVLNDLEPDRTYFLSFRKAGYRPRVTASLGPFGEGTHELPLMQLTPGRTVSGFVRDEQSMPIEGAVVALFEVSAFLAAFEGAPAREREATREIVTGADGSYTLPIDSRAFLLHASADGFSGGESGTMSVDRADELRYDFVLQPASTINGSVVDQVGRPVAGATIRLSPADETLGVGEVLLTSAGDGTFQSDAVPPGELAVRVVRDGFAPTVVVSAPPRVDLVVTLRSESSLVGEVAPDPSGRRLTIVEIVLMPVEESSAPVRFRVPIHRTSGRFRCSGIVPGEYRALGAADGWSVALPEIVRFEPGEELSLGSVPLVEKRLITGRVRDATGAAVGGARVFVHVVESGRGTYYFDGPGAVGEVAETAADGYFELHAVPPIPFEVRARTTIDRVGELAAYADAIRFDSGAAAEAASPLELFLRPYGAVVVSIRGRDGSPLSGRRVELRQGMRITQARTSPDGTFRFEDVRAGAATLAVFGRPSDGSAVRQVDVAAGVETEVEFVY